MNDEAISVTLLTRVLQETIEQGFPFVRVVGEVSNFKHHSSGHRYFTLKDDAAQIRCVMWRTRQSTFSATDGMRVIVTGRLTLYPSQGNYQIDCFSMQAAGVGELYIAFEKLKAELQKLGYFDTARKRQLPRFPLRVGVVTSPTGAAIRDILSTMEQRMPACTVVLRPALVQGDAAGPDIAQAISDLQTERCDVIIVGRGGGSIEDLWPFNTREVADAIYNSRIPIISAVGHESDVSIADFVADVRAATPTAAAVLCTPVRVDELLFELDNIEDNLSTLVQQRLSQSLETAKRWEDGSVRRIFQRQLSELARAIEITSNRLTISLQHRLAIAKTEVESHARTLTSLQPLAPLNRGFALVYKEGDIVGAADRLEVGDTIRIRRHLQEHEAEVLSSKRL